jgi:DNA repair protein RecO (recombination protein O)
MPNRHRTFRLEGIVLRHVDWGEADRLIILFSREQGKVRAIAKGIRKPQSRKAGHLEPFHRVNVLLAQGRDFPLITQAETLASFAPLQADLLRMGYAAYLLELVDRFSVEEEANPTLYQLLLETLEHLSQSRQPLFELRYFEVRLLDEVGFRPQLFHCVVCHEAIQPQDQFFSCEMGGVVCPTCAIQQRSLLPVSVQALKYLRHFQRSSYPEACRAKIAPATLQEMEELLGRYLQALLERGLNTPKFIRAVSHLQASQPADSDLKP